MTAQSEGGALAGSGSAVEPSESDVLKIMRVYDDALNAAALTTDDEVVVTRRAFAVAIRAAWALADRNRGALAGPESAAEHLRNAQQLLSDETLKAVPIPLKYSWGGVIPEMDWKQLEEHMEAVRRRVAAALAQLEAGA